MAKSYKDMERMKVKKGEKSLVLVIASLIERIQSHCHKKQLMVKL